MLDRHKQDWNETEIAIAQRLYEYLNVDAGVERSQAGDPLVSLTAKLLGRTPAAVNMFLRNIYGKNHPGKGLPHGSGKIR
jgi:hypothetical protein